jgi:hypothetical protein
MIKVHKISSSENILASLKVKVRKRKHANVGQVESGSTRTKSFGMEFAKQPAKATKRQEEYLQGYKTNRKGFTGRQVIITVA